jgi:hypothetical protein
LDEKIEAYQRETNAKFDAVNQKIDALRQEINAKFDRVTLILYFLIALTVLAMTVFNPTFVQTMRMLLKM